MLAIYVKKLIIVYRISKRFLIPKPNHFQSAKDAEGEGRYIPMGWDEQDGGRETDSVDGRRER